MQTEASNKIQKSGLTLNVIADIMTAVVNRKVVFEDSAVRLSKRAYNSSIKVSQMRSVEHSINLCFALSFSPKVFHTVRMPWKRLQKNAPISWDVQLGDAPVNPGMARCRNVGQKSSFRISPPVASEVGGGLLGPF